MPHRKIVDCSQAPDSKCSVQISGTEDEVIKVAVRHAVSDHGYPDTSDVRQQVRKMMKDA